MIHLLHSLSAGTLCCLVLSFQLRYLLCVCMHAYKWYMCACLNAPQHAGGDQRTTWRNSLLSSCGSWELNSGQQAWQVLLPAEPTHQPRDSVYIPFYHMCHYLRVLKAKDHCCSSDNRAPPSQLSLPNPPWLAFLSMAVIFLLTSAVLILCLLCKGDHGYFSTRGPSLHPG